MRYRKFHCMLIDSQNFVMARPPEMVAKMAPTQAQSLPQERTRGAEFIFEGLGAWRGPEGPQKRIFKNFAGASPRTPKTAPLFTPCALALPANPHTQNFISWQQFIFL